MDPTPEEQWIMASSECGECGEREDDRFLWLDIEGHGKIPVSSGWTDGCSCFDNIEDDLKFSIFSSTLTLEILRNPQMSGDHWQTATKYRDLLDSDAWRKTVEEWETKRNMDDEFNLLTRNYVVCKLESLDNAARIKGTE